MPQASDQAIVTSIALIALGSNLPTDGNETSEQIIRRALDEVSRRAGPITGKSRLFETPCFPAGAGPDFINAAIRIETRLSPAELLHCLHNLEADFGRQRRVRWGQRTLDLDLLAYDDLILPDPATQTAWRDLPLEEQARTAPDRLILPHPRLQDRAFVLVPLAEVAGDWRHPVLGRTVTEMLDALPQADKAEIRAIAA
ncbi:2-amino-4-hydroxy-6-hydroxymethyldihydropteridine diphosphokinase [Flavimaricola marinus]|uniref:2-amino-4-hydroxy-6-hydroxymethyldihydropteridine pyrophosphokinase n=1 Tax=Flavimaricola marinus TaxID=1819565 RepID=A0A238LA40_9RHOB|nr:2-amino-4-hydroxy-6-hydroxymethyldihydropteridine diphosphokinase [Flavimaricola marinus]SMY06471.1 2-amino-4-hydroxy-6-hydroxymethyldihydropteridinepyrophosphokinase [Flavimaricola marinus]